MIMKKYGKIFVCFFVAIIVASCTFAVYVQKNNSDSTQKVENPTSASMDSTHIAITNPLKVE